jgi:hypothetical protein
MVLSYAGASSSSVMDVATSGAGLILAAPQHERGIGNGIGMREWYLCKLCFLETEFAWNA